MDAMLLEISTEIPEPLFSCGSCPAVQRLERELEKLRAEFRWEVGYWKSQHAGAVKRIWRLTEELDHARGQVRSLQGKLFGRPSEKSAGTDRGNDLVDPEEVSAPPKKRGAQPGQAGHGRRDYSPLPVVEEFVSLPEESLRCPQCGKPAVPRADTEDSELLEIEVRAHRRRIRRRRYRATCNCDFTRRMLTAPPPPKLIPKGNYGISIWVHVLLDKYSSYRPTERLLGQLEQYDLDLPAGTVNDGLRRIEPMLQPIYEAFRTRNREGGFHQADETRWLVFVLLDGKKGYGWWLWVVLAADTVVYLLAPSRGHDVPQSHFGPEASGVLEVDRYSGYKAMTQVKSGRMALAFCWTHVRRDEGGRGQELAEVDRLGAALAAPHWPTLSLESGTAAASPRLREVPRARGTLASGGGGDAHSGGERTCRCQTPPTVPQGSKEFARALGGIDPLRG
jgi:transposase